MCWFCRIYFVVGLLQSLTAVFSARRTADFFSDVDFSSLSLVSLNWMSSQVFFSKEQWTSCQLYNSWRGFCSYLCNNCWIHSELFQFLMFIILIFWLIFVLLRHISFVALSKQACISPTVFRTQPEWLPLVLWFPFFCLPWVGFGFALKLYTWCCKLFSLPCYKFFFLYFCIFLDRFIL